MDDTFRTQWTITPHLPDESSALVDETHRRTQLLIPSICERYYGLHLLSSHDQRGLL